MRISASLAAYPGHDRARDRDGASFDPGPGSWGLRGSSRSSTSTARPAHDWISASVRRSPRHWEIAHDVEVLADSLGLGAVCSIRVVRGWTLGASRRSSAGRTRSPSGRGWWERAVSTGAGGARELHRQRPPCPLIPPRRAGSCRGTFRIGNEEMLQTMVSVRDDEQAPWIDWLWGETDPAVVCDPVLRRNLFSVLHEGLRQGPMGVALDNVALCGPCAPRVRPHGRRPGAAPG